MSVFCLNCAKQILESNICLTCENGCKSQFHFYCVGLLKSEFESMSEAEKYSWKCLDCSMPIQGAEGGDLKEERNEEPGSSDENFAPFPMIQIVEFLDSKLSEIRNEVQELRKDVGEFRNYFSSVVEDITNHILNLKSELKSDDGLMSALSSKLSKFRSSNLSTIQNECQGNIGASGNGASDVKPENASAIGFSLPDTNALNKMPQLFYRDRANMFAIPESHMNERWMKRSKLIPPVIGTRNVANAPVFPRNTDKSILVNRFYPEIKAKDIPTLLGETDFTYECVKLRTRNPSYSSFVLTVNEKYLDQLRNPEMWPEGCQIFDFSGVPSRVVGKPVRILGRNDDKAKSPAK